MKAMNPPVAITMPGTLSSSFPQPPAMSGVTPMKVSDNPMAMARTAIERMIHVRVLAGADGAAGAAVAAGLVSAVFVGEVLADLAAGVPARVGAGRGAPLGG